MLIDTHSHICLREFEEDLEQVLQRARQATVDKIICVGFDAETRRKSLDLADKYEGVYATLGVHPYEAENFAVSLFEEWEGILKKSKKVVAIGECGLDYFRGKADRELQKDCFRAQIEFAQKHDLPLIVHNRDADRDCLEILREYDVRAVFHCFASDVDFAREVWEAGFWTSFTGIITYPKSDDLREVVKEVPSERFMVETDCPFLAPQSNRGKRNEPSFVVEIAKKIAEVKGVSYEEVKNLSTENAKKFFKI